jgi:ATP-dependent helicase/DNAse subunit B
MSAREPLLNKAPTLPPSIHALADRQLLEELRTQTVWSASALESYASCPVRWFVERLLKAKDLDPDPEPLSRGTLAHEVLKDTFTALKLQTGSARLRSTTLELSRKLLAEILAEHAQTHQLSPSPERAAGVLRRLQADLERYLEYAAEIESPFEPEYFELAFGSPEERDGLDVLHLGDGVRIRGQIDRIDIDGQGRAIVYDYKGKNVVGAGKWLAENNFQLALYMRAAECLLDLDPVGGFYQPLAGKDPSARGILNDASQLELRCVRTDRLAPEDFHECLQQTLLAAHRAASEASSGTLTPRPESCGFDGNCSYPSICRCER